NGLLLIPRVSSSKSFTICFESLTTTETSLFRRIWVTKYSSEDARILTFSLTETSRQYRQLFQKSEAAERVNSEKLPSSHAKVRFKSFENSDISSVSSKLPVRNVFIPNLQFPRY